MLVKKDRTFYSPCAMCAGAAVRRSVLLTSHDWLSGVWGLFHETNCKLHIANYELRTTNCKIAQNTVLSLSLCKACQGTA